MIKEWAYAGIGISLISAFVSNAAVEGISGLTFFPFLILAILAISYVTYHKLKLNKPDSPTVYNQ